MKIERFEDIIAWQKSKELSVQVYGLFENSKDYGFKDQILRASVSVMNNIAEGFERRGNKEFRHFLYIAKGYCGEVRSILYLAKELNNTKHNDKEIDFIVQKPNNEREYYQVAHTVNDEKTFNIPVYMTDCTAALLKQLSLLIRNLFTTFT
jgi:four helix bundle protein